MNSQIFQTCDRLCGSVLVPVGAYFIRLARHHGATIFGARCRGRTAYISVYMRLMFIIVSSHCGAMGVLYVCMYGNCYPIKENRSLRTKCQDTVNSIMQDVSVVYKSCQGS